MKAEKPSMDETIFVTPSQLAEWLKEGKKVHILDVRPTEDHQEWSISESAHADIYKAIKSGDPDPFQGIEVPRDIPVVTVCTAGNASLTAAKKLREKDIEVYSLKGGMMAWNFAWSTDELLLPNGLSIVQVRRMGKGCLSYIVGSEEEAIVVDASLDPLVYVNLAKKRGWTIQYVMDTHIHADYVSRTRELAEVTGAGYLLHQDADTDFPFIPVDDHQEFSFGNAAMTALHTPGHTPDSLSYLIEGQVVFTGDTLFTDGVGRPDLKADKEEAVRKAKHLYRSLQMLLSLNTQTRVFPAHTAGSIGTRAPMISATMEEITGRTDLLSLPEKEFVDNIISRIPPPPPNHLEISELNKKGTHEGYRLEKLEAGANRCAVG